MSKETALLNKLGETQTQIMKSLFGFELSERLTVLSACIANILAHSISTDVINKEQACDVIDASLQGVKQVINMTSKVSTKAAFELNQ